VSDVTGPINTLPGSGHALPDGARCDEHQDRAAIARIQGETDSFGSEMLDVCQECLDAIRKHKIVGCCDWCHKEAELRPYRDLEEGMAGPVYHVCADCRRKDRASGEAEAEECLEYFDDDCV
jgi:hypothetical protein